MPLLLLLAACKDDVAAPPSPYEMPDVSGCTRTEGVWHEGLDLPTDLWTYTWGEHELQTGEVYEAMEYGDPEELHTVTSRRWSWDENDCLLAEEYLEVDEDVEYTESTAYTCDERGFHTHWSHVTAYDGSAWTRLGADVAVDVEDGLPVLQVEQVEDDRDEAWIVRTAWSWQDGMPLQEDTWEDQEWTAHQKWTYDDDGHVLTYTDGELWTWAELDEHGRYVRVVTAYDPEGASVYVVWTYEWFDEIYAYRTVTFDYLGDGVVDWMDNVYVFDCTDTWPWDCTYTVTSPGSTPSDYTLTVDWTCD